MQNRLVSSLVGLVLLAASNATGICASDSPTLSLHTSEVKLSADDSLEQKAKALASVIAQYKNTAPNKQSIEDLLLSASDTIELLAAHKQFAAAENLSQTKAKTAAEIFGEHSAMVLDSLQDSIFLASQRHEHDLLRQRLGRYAEATSAMKNEGLESEIARAESLRNQRLQNKMKAALDILRQPI